jgi:ABC-type amino acid transport system permease subunit
VNPEEAGSMAADAPPIAAPKLAWGAMLVTAAAAVLAFVVTATTRPSSVHGLVTELGLVLYLAALVFAIRTLDHLRSLRSLGEPTRRDRWHRRLAWAIIATFAGTPIVFYIVFLIALSFGGGFIGY